MIKKITFRNQVRAHLISKMRNGQLKNGQLISLAAMARELEVSVTPIREALTQLEQSHLVEGIPNRGFGIPSLNKQEAVNIYELIAALEALAITNATITTLSLNTLTKKADVFQLASEGLERINADMEFHQALVANYKNPIAKQMIEDLKVRIFFYEKRFMDVANHEQSVTDHDNIIKALEENKPQIAADIVQKNWLQILKHIDKIL